ncbi:MAG TPA: hypothetical protein VFI17_10345 [Solirubrobacterales bacterium]|nr:hypothetical protein [Solirubrobacterales bacterium]
MNQTTVTLTLSRPDAEIMLGVLAAERHNPDVDAVCEALRKQIDEQLAEPSGG